MAQSACADGHVELFDESGSSIFTMHSNKATMFTLISTNNHPCNSFMNERSWVIVVKVKRPRHQLSDDTKHNPIGVSFEGEQNDNFAVDFRSSLKNFVTVQDKFSSKIPHKLFLGHLIEPKFWESMDGDSNFVNNI